jgi:hypothetical protein
MKQNNFLKIYVAGLIDEVDLSADWERKQNNSVSC